MKVIEKSKLSEIDYYPLVIDFDFINLKPRGGSSKIDFFSYGALCNYTDGLAGNVVYIEKKDIIPSQGFFLIDFNKAEKEEGYFANIFNNINIDKLFIENSPRYNMHKMLEGIEEIELCLVNFV